MSKTVYLHIGLEKTGTSSVQAYFAQNKDALEKADLLYPFSTHAPYVLGDTHWPVAACHIASQNKFAPEPLRDPSRVCPPLLEAIHTSDCEKVLISAEPFSSHMRNIKEIKRLHNTFADFKTVIVIYLRRQDNFFESLISTIVKGGVPIDFAGNFRFEATDACWENDDRYDFKKILDNWSSVFGKENICARIFERDLLVNGSVIDDILHITQTETEGLQPKQAAVKNYGLNLNALLFMNTLNAAHLFIGSPHERHAVIEYLEEWSKQKGKNRLSLIPNSLRQTIIDRYQASNALVKAAYFPEAELPDHLFSTTDITEHKKRPIDAGAISIKNAEEIAQHFKQYRPELYGFLAKASRKRTCSTTESSSFAISIIRHAFQ